MLTTINHNKNIFVIIFTALTRVHGPELPAAVHGRVPRPFSQREFISEVNYGSGLPGYMNAAPLYRATAMAPDQRLFPMNQVLDRRSHYAAAP